MAEDPQVKIDAAAARKLVKDDAEAAAKLVVETTDGRKYLLVPRGILYGALVISSYIAILLTVLLILVIPTLGTNNNQNSQLRTLSIQNRTALCDFRADLERRANASQHFLISHPHGLPAFGISAASIEKEVSNQERSIATLSILSCKPQTTTLPAPTPTGR